jgi:hypothetical protein
MVPAALSRDQSNKNKHNLYGSMYNGRVREHKQEWHGRELHHSPYNQRNLTMVQTGQHGL